jgi:hypothetical protein
MTRMTRRTATLAGACAALVGVSSPVRSRAESATVPVVGRKLRWTSVLPNNGWLGGRADDIKSKLAEIQQNKNIDAFGQMVWDRLIGGMVPFAETCDVYFRNLKEGPTKSSTITTLRTDVVDPEAKGNFSDEQFRSGFAKQLAVSMAGAPGARENAPKLTSSGGQVESAKEAKIAGRPAMTIKLRGGVENGTAFNDVVSFVALPDGRWHSIWLTVDSERASARLNDLDRMLRAVRYSG